MNTSNPYGTDSIAPQRQADIEQQLQQTAQLGAGHPRRALRARLILLALGLIITLAVAAFAV